MFLVGHDSDPFNRWEAAQQLAREMLIAAGKSNGEIDAERDAQLAEAFGLLAADDRLDPEYRAFALQLPAETDIAEAIGDNVDPERIHAARTALKRSIGERIGDNVRETAARYAPDAEYSPDAANAGKRSFRNAALDLAHAGGRVPGSEIASAYEAATNLTDRFGALRILVLSGAPEADAVLAAFHDRYEGNPLVTDKWLAIQAIAPGAATLDRVKELRHHPAFSARVPNRVYSLIRTFGVNPTGFNRADGAGYRFLADFIAELDPHNPSVAARLATCFRSYRMMEAGRRDLAEQALASLSDKSDLSRDVADIIGRIQAG